jgi:hypothetical protein
MTSTEIVIPDIEKWIEIQKCDGYMISNFGNIKSCCTKKEKIMKLRSNNYGYKIVHFGRKGIKKNFKVHRLVAIMFIPNPDNKAFVDHIDGNHTNNHISNLRWATPRENTHNRSKTLKQTSSTYKGVYFNKKAKKWRASIYVNGVNKNLGYFVTEAEAAAAYNTAATIYFKDFVKINNIIENRKKVNQKYYQAKKSNTSARDL